MTDGAMFAAFLTLALLVPAILLLLISLASWLLPPATSWLSAFGQRHRFALALLEIGFWLALFARQLASGPPWPDPFTPGASLFLAGAALVKAFRRPRRGDAIAPPPAN